MACEVMTEELLAEVARHTESPRAVLVVVAGAAGVGKSTLARRIARVTGLTVLDKDVLTVPSYRSCASW